MNRADLIKEVTNYITENFNEKEDIDVSDAGSQLEDHLTNLAEDEDEDEDGEDE